MDANFESSTEGSLESLEPETSESLVNWLIELLRTRDFDEPLSLVPHAIHHKIINAIIARGSESIQPLLTMLNDKDEEVRNAAALALGRLQADETVEPLIRCLQSDPSRHVQATVANALYEIGNPKGIEIASQWKRAQKESGEFVIRNRLNNFVSLGHTDRVLHRRLQELADHYDVEPTDIARSCLTYTQTERQQIRAGNAAAFFGSVMITEEEYRSIQEID